MKLHVLGLMSALTLFATAAGAGDTLPKEKAVEIGAKSCLSKVEQVADYLLEDAPHGSDTTWNNKNVDGRLLSFFVSRGYSDGDSQVNMQFAPTASGCDAVYTETFVVESQCTIVREDTFKKWKFRGSLNKKTVILQTEEGSVDIYLTPAGKKGDLCLVTKREVVY